MAGGFVRSAHDASDGGVAVTLAECCFDTNGIGAEVELTSHTAVAREWSSVETLFGEAASIVVLSAREQDVPELMSRAATSGVPCRRVGTTGGDRLRVRVDGHAAIDVSVRDAEHVWATAIERRFARRVA